MFKLLGGIKLGLNGNQTVDREVVEAENQLEKLNQLVEGISNDIIKIVAMQNDVEKIAKSLLEKSQLDPKQEKKVTEIFETSIKELRLSLKKHADKFDEFDEFNVIKLRLVEVLTANGLSEELKIDCQSVMNKYPKIDWKEIEPLLEGKGNVEVPLVSLEKTVLENSIPGYSHVRKVKGDGSCYYRSVMVGLLEQILDPKNPKRSEQLLDLATKFSRLKPDSEIRSQFVLNSLCIQKLIDRITETATGEGWKSVEEFLEEVKDSSSEIDNALILGARYLLADHIMNIAHKFLNQATGELLEPDGTRYFHTDGTEMSQIGPLMGCKNPEKMMDFCRDSIFSNKEAEGVPVNLGFFADIFGFSLENCSDLGTVESNKGDIKVSILRRGSHYDILYPNVEKNVKAAPALNRSKSYAALILVFVAYFIAVWVQNSLKNQNGK
jgi:hypothetical protein